MKSEKAHTIIKIYKYTKNTVALSGLEFNIETNLKHKPNELHASLKKIIEKITTQKKIITRHSHRVSLV